MHIVHAGADHDYVLAYAGDQVFTGIGDLGCDSIGRFTSQGGYRNRNIVDTFVLHVVRAGRGTIQCGSREHPIGPGSMFALLPGVPAVYGDQPSDPWRYWWIKFTGAAAARWFARWGLRKEEPTRSFRSSCLPALSAVIEDAHDRLGRRCQDRMTACAVAWRLALAIDDALDTGASTPDEPEHIVRGHLDTGYHVDQSISALAASVGLDRTTLFRRFQAAFGCSPVHYLQRLRIEAARGLLRHAGLDHAEIARMTGFPSVRSLRAALRRRRD
jgi:AraC-like DNA-binding protein